MAPLLRHVARATSGPRVPAPPWSCPTHGWPPGGQRSDPWCRSSTPEHKSYLCFYIILFLYSKAFYSTFLQYMRLPNFNSASLLQFTVRRVKMCKQSEFQNPTLRSKLFRYCTLLYCSKTKYFFRSLQFFSWNWIVCQIFLYWHKQKQLAIGGWFFQPTGPST